jgi:hypothetical protein
MRVLRTILGMLLLTIGLPALLVGAGFWAAMQHRDAGGAYGGATQDVVTTGYAVVVDDADRLLRADAPFTRIGDTRLRITAYTADGPAFVGIAPASDVAAYLKDVPRQTVRSVDIGTGVLPVSTTRVSGAAAPAVAPAASPIWWRIGSGHLDWTPSELRNRPYSLVIMNPGARPGLQLNATAEIRPGWLNSSTWALLVLGSLAAMAGLIVLAWPVRRREVVYVVEPSQVPDLIKAIGAPLPLSRIGVRRHARPHRPRTLADPALNTSPPELPRFNWPPSRSGDSAAPVQGSAIPFSGSAVPGSPVSAAAVSGVAASERVSPETASSGTVSSGPITSAPITSGLGASRAAGSGVAASGATAFRLPLAQPSLSGRSPSGRSLSGTPGSALSGPPSAAEYAAATAIPPVPGHGVGRRSPAPGEPLSLIGQGSPSLGSPISPAAPAGLAGLAGAGAGPAEPARPDATDREGPEDSPLGRPSEPAARRRGSAPIEDVPVFEASAVSAWVAETSAARARETEARAAAVLAAEASRSGKPAAARGGRRAPTHTDNAPDKPTVPNPVPSQSHDPAAPAPAQAQASAPVSASASVPASASASVPASVRASSPAAGSGSGSGELAALGTPAVLAGPAASGDPVTVGESTVSADLTDPAHPLVAPAVSAETPSSVLGTPTALVSGDSEVTKPPAARADASGVASASSDSAGPATSTGELARKSATSAAGGPTVPMALRPGLGGLAGGLSRADSRRVGLTLPGASKRVPTGVDTTKAPAGPSQQPVAGSSAATPVSAVPDPAGPNPPSESTESAPAGKSESEPAKPRAATGSSGPMLMDVQSTSGTAASSGHAKPAGVTSSLGRAPGIDENGKAGHTPATKAVRSAPTRPEPATTDETIGNGGPENASVPGSPSRPPLSDGPGGGGMTASGAAPTLPAAGVERSGPDTTAPAPAHPVTPDSLTVPASVRRLAPNRPATPAPSPAGPAARTDADLPQVPEAAAKPGTTQASRGAATARLIQASRSVAEPIASGAIAKPVSTEPSNEATKPEPAKMSDDAAEPFPAMASNEVAKPAMASNDVVKPAVVEASAVTAKSRATHAARDRAARPIKASADAVTSDNTRSSDRGPGEGGTEPSSRVGVAGRRDYPAVARRDGVPAPAGKGQNEAPSGVGRRDGTASSTTKRAGEGEDDPGAAPATRIVALGQDDVATVSRAGRGDSDAVPVAELAGNARPNTPAGKPGQDQTATGTAKQVGPPGSAEHKSDPHIAEQRAVDDRNRPGTEPKPGPEVRPAANITRPTKESPAASEGRQVPGARQSNYAEEAAELLAGLSPNRKRRKTATGLPATDPATDQPPIKMTRLPRRGQAKPPAGQ